tara:strand:- start:27 stop:581 length:555 start_codon:yes stop_codon:yes gene_type:complete
MNLNIYYFINEFDKNEIEKLSSNISIIYRNYEKKKNYAELKGLVTLCKKKRQKIYISNDLKSAIQLNFNGIYIPSFNKNLSFKNISRNNLEIIGSAHNFEELKTKEKQGCSIIFLSPVFENNKKKKFLGIIKANFLKNHSKSKIVLLGGINSKTLRKCKLCSPEGIASISWVKKNGPSINTGPF